jgi:hypothetical protein
MIREAGTGKTSFEVSDMEKKDNLKQFRWKKFQSGNPSGKPKYGSLTQALRRIGFEIDPEAVGDVSYYEAAARVWWWNACHGSNGGGSPRSIEAIANRLDGKPAESVTLTATVVQRSAEEHAQAIFETLQRLKQHEESGDRRFN